MMKLSAAGRLSLTVMVMAIALTTSTTASPAPAQRAAADDKSRYMAKKHETPASRIRPIANKPLEVRDEDPNSDAALASNFLTQYGYHRKEKPLDFLASPPAGSDNRRQEPEQAQALRLFQSYFGLEQTGKLDQPTLNLMKKDRCGVADIPPEAEEEEGSSRETNRNRQSPSNYALLGTKWEKNRLTWKLDTASTNQLHPTKQRRIMQDAFEAWRRVAPLEFTEKRRRGDKVDIDIKFGSRSHGDDYPFDGKGKVLAHAFGPGEGDIDGDMHFDNQEDWRDAEEGGVSDLYLVATHELGHSLGLSHSRDPGALMYPYYGLMDRLGPDDIKAIQSLYGIRIGQHTTRAPVTRRPRPTTTTRRPITRAPYTRRPTRTQRPRPQTTTSVPARECGVEFDVVIQDPQQRHVYSGIHGNQIYRFTEAGVLPNFPSPLHSFYPGAPVYAETVFTVPEKFATYFIKDNKVWRYHGSQLDSDYPKDLDPTHFPEVIRFVLPIVDNTGHRRIFVFGRTLWWEYNFDNVPALGSYYRPRPNLIPQYWPAVSSDVSYAVMGNDHYIYLISPHRHVVLDSFRRAIPGGRREGHPQWMKPACQMRTNTDSGSSTVGVKSFGLTWSLSALSLLLLVLRK